MVFDLCIYIFYLKQGFIKWFTSSNSSLHALHLWSGINQYKTMKEFKKYYIVPAPPEDIYKALTFEPTIQLWTGDKAEMKEEVGSEFSLWDGSIVGKNLEFEEGKKIVQHWYFGEDETEQSIVTIKLHADKQGTSVELKQTNIPDEAYEDMVDGWNNYYFKSLIDFYEE